MNAYSGEERFFVDPDTSVATVNDFWRWSGSDLLDNAYRGMLAEFLVARALDLKSIARAGWGLYDLLYGDIKIEVKSSAYIQSWEQGTNPDGTPKLYLPRFDIHAAATPGKRPSDIYVFSLLNSKDRAEINPLNLQQWDFYVLKTSVIDSTFGSQKSVALKMIENNALHTKFEGLKQAIDLTGCQL